MKIKNTNNSRKEGIEVREVCDSDFPDKEDRLFELSVSGVFRGENVRLAVERVVQWGFEIVQWQRLAGVTPGSMPSFQNFEGKEIKKHLLERNQPSHLGKDHPIFRAHATFCAMVELYIVAFEARWVSSMCNNIAAMDLSDDHPEVASVLRHALEKSCVVNRFQWEPAQRASLHPPEGFLTTAVAGAMPTVRLAPATTNSQETTQEPSKDPIVGEFLEKKSSFELFISPKAPQLLNKSFWKAVAHRGKFNPRAHIQAQINLVSVSVQTDMSPTDGLDDEDAEAHELDQTATRPNTKVKMGRSFFGFDNNPKPPHNPNETDQSNEPGKNSETDEFDDFDKINKFDSPPAGIDELLMVGGASRWLSRKVLNMISPQPNESGCAVVVVPRLFAHEEFSSLSMQLLNDLPLRIARAIESESDEADLATTVCLHLGVGGIGNVSLDTDLMAQARMHYLVSIVYRQIDVESESILSIALNDCDVLIGDIDGHRLQVLDDSLNEICRAVTPLDVVLVPKDIDSFFTGLRDGIRRQRGQVFLEQMAELLDQHQAVAENCYFEVRKNPTSAGFLFCVSDGWLQYIGETPWTHLNFDLPEVQHSHLLMLAKVVGFRNKSDVFMVGGVGHS